MNPPNWLAPTTYFLKVTLSTENFGFYNPFAIKILG